MQVKKFEARNMKEALQLVKNSMGPEAIILAAKDINHGFGIAGGSGVEVTAAASEQTLQKKKFAESRMNERDLSRFTTSTAAEQKRYIEKAVERQIERTAPRPNITTRSYIDIDDSYQEQERAQVQERVRIQPTLDQNEANFQNSTRVKSAAEAAKMAAFDMIEDDVREQQAREEQLRRKQLQAKRARAQRAEQQTASAAGAQQINQLRNEIRQLKGVISEFQRVPQNFVSLHPGATEGVPYELSETYEKFLRAGVSKDNVLDILQLAKQALSVEQVKRTPIVNAWVVKYFLENTKVVGDKNTNRYQVFVGSTGQGKTSSLVKMASDLAINKQKKVAIVSADVFKVGASEQLKIYSQILNVPFCEIRKGSQWASIERQLSEYDHILVDFPGLTLKTMNEIEFIRDLLPGTEGGRSIHYVQSVLSKDEDAFELASRYMPVQFDDVIFTRLDESVQHGMIYNFQKKFGVPLHSFGIGTAIPEDFEVATKERVVDLIFKLSKLTRANKENI